MSSPNNDVLDNESTQANAAENASDATVERHQTAPTESSASSETNSQDDIATLTQQLEAAEAKAQDNWDKFIRSQAELDNIKKRAQRDLENAHKYGLEKFANELLAVRDSMEMGLTAAKADDANLDTLREGSDMTFKMLDQVLQKFQIEVLDPVNQKFNPELHQAMSALPNDDVEPNTVLTVMQKGYTLSGRLLRPALVVVSKAT